MGDVEVAAYEHVSPRCHVGIGPLLHRVAVGELVVETGSRLLAVREVAPEEHEAPEVGDEGAPRPVGSLYRPVTTTLTSL